MSVFDSIYGGTDCSTYSTSNDDLLLDYELGGVDSALWHLALYQNQDYKEVEWTVQSIDVLLGIIGGFTGLLWDILGSSLDRYEAFKFGTSLIS